MTVGQPVSLRLSPSKLLPVLIFALHYVIYANHIYNTFSFWRWRFPMIHLHQSSPSARSSGDWTSEYSDKRVLIGFVLFLSVMLPTRFAHAQQNDTEERFTVRGRVTDAQENRPLVGATVTLTASDRGASTDSTGAYALSLPSGSYTVKYDFVGYESETRVVELQADRTVNIRLSKSTVSLDELLITEEASERNVESLTMGVERLEPQSLERGPTFLGEPDIIRSLLQLPGVSSVGEGAAGFNVRGGSVDQNLILFDGTAIYYPSHLLGFFSPFNADVVSDVTLYKGGIPAQYGGRAASVLRVEQKVGDRDRYGGRGGVSPITSRLSVEGPIVEDKASFVLGGRLSYVNWLLDAVDNPNLQRSNASFYDANVGVNIKPTEDNEIDLMGYRAYDDVGISDTLFTYATTNASVEWRHLTGDSFVTRLKGAFSNYDFRVRDQDRFEAFTLNSQIRTYKAKAEATWTPNDRHTVDIGLQSAYHEINPGDVAPNSPVSDVDTFATDNEYGIESAAYLSDNITVTDRLSARLGLRFSMFNQTGPSNTYVYASNRPRNPQTIIDTVTTESGEIAKTDYGLEPRVSLRYRLTDQSSLKVGYNRMRQYLHLITNSTAALPLDVWHVSDAYRQPQIADQVSVGYFQNFDDGAVITSVEAYYKWIDNLIDYKPGAELLLNRTLNADLLNGIGRAYGVEMFAEKTEGQLTGSISYTYSRAERKVDGATPIQRINGGDWYPANYDRPHEISISATYTGDDPRAAWNANFVYRTGRPITYPVSKFVVDDRPIAQYSSRNQVRIPDYHRLDLSLRLDLERREKRGWNASWTLSIYNVYGRKNAYSVFFGRKENGNIPQPFRLSIFGTVFPSLTYTFEF